MPPSHQPSAPNPAVISGSAAQLPSALVVVEVAGVVVVMPCEVDVETGAAVVVGDSDVVETGEEIVETGDEVVVSPASDELHAATTKTTIGKSLRIIANLAIYRAKSECSELSPGV